MLNGHVKDRILCMGKTRLMTVGGVMYPRLCEKHNHLIEITLRVKVEEGEKEEKTCCMKGCDDPKDQTIEIRAWNISTPGEILIHGYPLCKMH